MNTKIIHDNSDTWVEEENIEPDQSLHGQKENRLIFIILC